MDRYVKIKRVGEGAMGTADLVKRKADGAQVIVKVINVRGLEMRERAEAMQEVMVHQELRHPNIASLFEAFLEEGNLYIVMEYADGGELAQVLHNMKGKGLGEGRAWDIFSQVCLAIDYVHSKGIVHRDVKPSNILLTKKGDVKLADFGIARVMSTDHELAETTVGTPYYMSPEICEDTPYNRKSDVWAMGCVLYEMVMGRRPFEANNLPSLIMKIVKGSYQELPSSFSSDLKSCIRSMLQKNPTSRPEVRSILETVGPVKQRVKPYMQELAEKLESTAPVVLQRPPPEALVSTMQGQAWMQDMQNIMRDAKDRRSKAPSLAATVASPGGRALGTIDEDFLGKTAPARQTKDKPAGKLAGVKFDNAALENAVSLPAIKNRAGDVSPPQKGNKSPIAGKVGKDKLNLTDPGFNPPKDSPSLPNKNKPESPARKPQKLAALDSGATGKVDDKKNKANMKPAPPKADNKAKGKAGLSASLPNKGKGIALHV